MREVKVMKSSFTSRPGIPSVSLSAADKGPSQSRGVEARSESDLAKSRILSAKGDPFLFADWERVLFLHYVVAPEVLQPLVSAPLELDLYEGKGCITLVALTMRHFRPCGWAPTACLLQPLSRQHFLNLRTYVRLGSEPGALFLWGWLSRPCGAPVPSGLFGLPYTFASVEYQHEAESGKIHGLVTDGANRFAYTATARPGVAPSACAPHSLSEFAMERYSGFFSRKHETRVFRTWHPPWKQIPTDACTQDDTLLTSQFPWFKQAMLTSANFAVGFEHVWLGRAHTLAESRKSGEPSHHVLSSFYEMP
jgi:uncharacterized protein YqjF (DUF2071 family)